MIIQAKKVKHMKKEMTLQEIQQASLAVLKEIDRICQESNICYWIAYGTLIGAVRHGGFIPWDDDVDIVMPRKDYEAFIAYVESDLYRNNQYKLFTAENCKGYPFYISRFADTTHELIFEKLDYTSGCFVDIYPYDGMGNEEGQAYWKVREKKLQFAQKKLIMSAYPGWLYGNSFAHKIGNLPQMILCKLFGKSYYFRKLDRYRMKYTWEESKYVGNACWSGGTYLFPKELFTETIRFPFEDTEVNVPKEYEGYLNKSYRNYRLLPPEEERVPYHEYTAYNKEQE